MERAFIGLGANLGDRLVLLRAAVRRLREHLDINHISPVYETEPVGYLDQPRFLNAVIEGVTYLRPHDLLSALHEIEAELGRERSFPNAPRTIDLDLLFYGDTVINDATLTVPHARLHERLFVLVPLADLAPDLVHPILHRTVMEMRLDIDDPWDVREIGDCLSDGAPS